MKTFLLSVILIYGLSYISYGQDGQEISKSFPATDKVVLETSHSALLIEATTGNEIQIETIGYKAPPERAKGLRSLSSRGNDNTGMGLEVTNTGGTTNIVKATGQSIDYKIRVPAKTHLNIKNTGWQKDPIKILGLTGEIEVQTMGSDIHLEQVTGPIVAHTTSGDILVKFASVNQAKPTSIVNTSGYIDVTIPATAKATLHLRSTSGSLYSDLDLDTKKDGMNMYSNRITGQLNGGGVEISLHSVSSDVFVRKQ